MVLVSYMILLNKISWVRQKLSTSYDNKFLELRLDPCNARRFHHSGLASHAFKTSHTGQY